MIDTSAALLSKIGRTKYVSYCRATGRDVEIDANRSETCNFGISSAKSDGIVKIFFPLGRIWMVLELHVVDAEVHILLSTDDMATWWLFQEFDKPTRP